MLKYCCPRNYYVSKIEDDKTRKMIGPVKSTINNKSYSLSKKTNFVELVLSLASKGQTLGFEDGIFGRCYTTSMKCSSNEGTLYQVKCSEFFPKLRRDTKCWKNVEEMSQ